MNRVHQIWILILIFSCTSGPTRNQKPLAKDSVQVTVNAVAPKAPDPWDTTSSTYFVYLLENANPLNHYWAQKLDSLDIYVPIDSLSHLSLSRQWTMNDSISVIIVQYASGTGSDEWLMTISRKKDIKGNLHISDNHDSDLSPDNPYYYMDYKLFKDVQIELFKHKVTGSEGVDEHDHLLPLERWVIKPDGRIVKNK